MLGYDSLYKAFLSALNIANLTISDSAFVPVAPSTATTINAGSVHDIKPPAGKAWVIVNLYFSGQCDFRIVDVATEVFSSSFTSADSMQGYQFILTQNHFIRIANTGASSITMTYSGFEKDL